MRYPSNARAASASVNGSESPVRSLITVLWQSSHAVYAGASLSMQGPVSRGSYCLRKATRPLVQVVGYRERTSVQVVLGG
jgi:hypothetical protein